ncbi:MAG: GGDEF domain-containing protein [Ilumatobacter sp.]|nr:GGDEF domain-containing protein [Ilumatobacter sp.]
MRRASLVFSLVLIVAIAVGYVARTSALADQRDARLTSASELGAARLTAIVRAASVAAQAATDPASTAVALAAVHPDVGVCVVGPDGQVCDGDGPAPSEAALAEEAARRADPDVGSTDIETDVTVYDSRMTVVAQGRELTVFVTAPADVVDGAFAYPVKATTLLPAEARVGQYSVDRGLRQTSSDVESAAGVYVVATADDEVRLPDDEYRFYLVIFALAVTLMLLAGVNLVAEQRNLLERASFDPLTKLPNRSEFERRAKELLALAVREQRKVCILMFDLNGFKKVNDTYGHKAGDELLKVVGSRLRKAVRDHDIVARWGGDEFVAVMPGIDSEEMGARRARQLAEQIGGRTRLDGVEDPIRVKVSVGVAVWPGHGHDLDSLVIAADQAMYEAKRDGSVCRIAEEPPAEPELVYEHAVS